MPMYKHMFVEHHGLPSSNYGRDGRPGVDASALTVVGDHMADKALMLQLEARLVNDLQQAFNKNPVPPYYITNLPPSQVLDRLSANGWEVYDTAKQLQNPPLVVWSLRKLVVPVNATAPPPPYQEC